MLATNVTNESTIKSVKITKSENGCGLWMKNTEDNYILLSRLVSSRHHVILENEFEFDKEYILETPVTIKFRCARVVLRVAKKKATLNIQENGTSGRKGMLHQIQMIDNVVKCFLVDMEDRKNATMERIDNVAKMLHEYAKSL